MPFRPLPPFPPPPLVAQHSIEEGNPIRLFRGHPGGQGAKIFTFDGMYKVTDHKQCRGKSGLMVFEFRLERLPNQPGLTTDQVRFIQGKAVPKSVKDCEG